MKIFRHLDPDGAVQFAAQAADGGFERLSGSLFGGLARTGEPAQMAKLLAPLEPAALLCIGLNYRRHAEETKGQIPEYPVLFFKGPNAVQNPGDPILLPRHLSSDAVDYECELAVVIGKPCKNVARENALEYVLGYTCANDVSARDWQIYKGGGQWCRGKTFDTFAPLGPCLVTADEIPNPNALGIRTLLNGEAMQDWNTNDMIFDVPALIAFLSGSTTLLPGTVILTGTPHGVGMARRPRVYLQPGDTVTMRSTASARSPTPFWPRHSRQLTPLSPPEYTSPFMDADLRQKIYDFIEKRGLRKTVQREAIIQAAFGTAEHYTAEELIAMARQIEPTVSRATVYRTLPLLVESGYLKEIDLGKDHKTYDPNFVNRPFHNHLICTDCHKVVEFEDVHIDTLENCISKRLGFSPSAKTVRIEATCDNLKRFGECQNKPK